MNEREMALKNQISKYRVGSHLYGTNLPTSDEDFAGIFIADLEYYLGFGKVEEVDLSKVSKDEVGKNTADAIDYKLFEIRKFFRLAMENNPNVIEQVFVQGKHIVYPHPLGSRVFQLAPLFPWKGCYDKFKGYAKSQKHKMHLKPENRIEIMNALKWVNDNITTLERTGGDVKEFGKLRIDRFTAELEELKIAKDEKTHLRVGDLNCCTSWTINRLKGVLDDRIEKMSHRTEMWDKFGYDTKFAMHLLRLLYECEELLNTKVLHFPLNHATRDHLLAVRRGEFKLEEVLQQAADLEERVDRAYEKTKLPSSPNYERLQKELMYIVKAFHHLQVVL